jgi:hypothetical protein
MLSTKSPSIRSLPFSVRVITTTQLITESERALRRAYGFPSPPKMYGVMNC